MEPSAVRFPIDAVPPALQRHAGDVPEPARMMGARGLVPAPPQDLIALLAALSFDPVEGIRNAARASLRDMPADLRRSAAAAPLHGAVLYVLSDVDHRDEALVEAILRNRNTTDETYARIARWCSESLSGIIAGNEVRALRHPAIIENLFLNENVLTSVVDRLLELGKRNNVSFDGLPALQALIEDPRFSISNDPGRDDRFKAQLAKSRLEELEEEHREGDLSDEEYAERKLEEEEKGGSTASKNKSAEISNMSISEKVRLATLGSKGDRELLIKDPNRLVHMSAARSPKVQRRDLLSWAGNKQVPDNVLSYIANHPRYRRDYPIAVALCNNPKLPFTLATRLLPNLLEKDLKKLERSRAISPPVKRFVKNMLDQRKKGRR